MEGAADDRALLLVERRELGREDAVDLGVACSREDLAVAAQRSRGVLAQPGRTQHGQHRLEDARAGGAEAVDALVERQVTGRRVGEGGDLGELALPRLRPQGLHVGEVAEDGAQRHPGPGCDALGGGLEVALLLEGEQRVDDRAAGALPSSGASVDAG